MAWNTGSRLPGDELMTLRTLEAAASCSSASSRSRRNRATSLFTPPARELRLLALFEASRGFRVAGFSARFLIVKPPLFEGRRIAFPKLKITATLPSPSSQEYSSNSWLVKWVPLYGAASLQGSCPDQSRHRPQGEMGV